MVRRLRTRDPDLGIAGSSIRELGLIRLLVGLLHEERTIRPTSRSCPPHPGAEPSRRRARVSPPPLLYRARGNRRKAMPAWPRRGHGSTHAAAYLGGSPPTPRRRWRRWRWRRNLWGPRGRGPRSPKAGLDRRAGLRRSSSPLARPPPRKRGR